ncbi:MAG TPA: alanine--tRNA ligase-related protein [Candidatus Babeliaceae bacterium]|nr:alanine--tRNA ligase-related protein [Candidatus Babeliaceae bacterium]
MKTRLIYLENVCQLDGKAQIIDIISGTDGQKIVLDQTVFYPQGGGQPSDKGTISNDNASFDVQHVILDEGIAYHSGSFKHGHFSKGEQVELHVDLGLRNLHNKNHTAGHLIDYALTNLGYSLAAGKAYHFPQGPYVEYQRTLEQHEREQLQRNLESEVNRLIQEELPVTITLLDNDPLKRVMLVNSYPPILCGGTHVLNTRDIGQVIIRKIKNEKGNLRVSYAVL